MMHLWIYVYQIVTTMLTIISCRQYMLHVWMSMNSIIYSHKTDLLKSQFRVNGIEQQTSAYLFWMGEKNGSTRPRLSIRER